jgi:cytidylate kinase
VNAHVVTLSATFGAGGAAVGPAVAERLGLPFLDRAIPASVAAEIGCTLEEALAHDDRAERGLGRILADAARLPGVTFGGMDVYLPEQSLPPEQEFVSRTEKTIRRVADGPGGVVLGRAAALVLADHPRALHVRLDGPRERRLAQARQTAASLDPATTALDPGADLERVLDDNDRARAAYVRHFYRADPAHPRHYHLVVDSTRLPVETVVDLIVRAATD